MWYYFIVILISLFNICIYCDIITHTCPASDHVECELDSLNLTSEQYTYLTESFALLQSQLNDESYLHKASETHWIISPHQLYRYYISGKWTGKYNGKSIVTAAIDTLNWRSTAYVNGADKGGRSIAYFKIGNVRTYISPQVMIKTLMYTIERADRESVINGSGEFIAVIDLAKMSFLTAPSFNVIKEAISLLKYNYPYRLNKIIILHASTFFTTLWGLVKPLMPAAALRKTLLLSAKEMKQVLFDVIGEEYLEMEYGGLVPPIVDFTEYVRTGYWFYNSSDSSSHSGRNGSGSKKAEDLSLLLDDDEL